jgi:hypothetical protein
MHVYIHISLTSALAGGECSASRPGRFTPGGKSPRYPLDRGFGGPQSRSGQRAENPWQYWESSSDPSVVQLVASRYTNYAIQAPVWKVIDVYENGRERPISKIKQFRKEANFDSC